MRTFDSVHGAADPLLTLGHPRTVHFCAIARSSYRSAGPIHSRIHSQSSYLFVLPTPGCRESPSFILQQTAFPFAHATMGSDWSRFFFNHRPSAWLSCVVPLSSLFLLAPDSEAVCGRAGPLRWVYWIAPTIHTIIFKDCILYFACIGVPNLPPMTHY